MLLLDFSQIFLSNIMMHFRNEARKSNPHAESLLKHMVLSTILHYKNRFGKDYGEVVLAIDSRSYWRRDKFPQYKGLRKESRDKSDLDWDFIFKALDSIKQDLRDNFPYKLVEANGAEADDVIAVLTKYVQTHQLKKQGLVKCAQPIMIISADTDFCQLQKYQGVKQYSPMQKKMIKAKVSLREFAMDHICGGDSGDGVPNICSPDDALVSHTRQKNFMKSRLPDFINKGIDACKNDEERRNFQRNQLMVDFDFIPKDVQARIIDSYVNQTPVNSKQKIFAYLVKNRMKNLLESSNEF